MSLASSQPQTKSVELQRNIAGLEPELQVLRTRASGAGSDSHGETQRELTVANIDLKMLFEGTHPADAFILSQLEDAVMFCDAECRIVYANAAFERLLGWPCGEAIGKNAAFRFPPGAREDVKRAMMQIMSGHPYSVDLEDYRLDGSRIWMHWRAQRIINADNLVIGTVNVGVDITDRKRAETEREELQRQLFQAQKLDTLGTLAGGIAHDFNNILAIIFGYTELALARATLDEQSQKHHRQVIKATQRGRELVKRILSFSRFHQPERRPIILSEVLTEAAKFIRAILPTTVEIVVELPEECPATLGDPDQLHQVLLNLATNAAHAMPNQHGTLTLELSIRANQTQQQTATGSLSPGNYLVITATDSGIGMEPATRLRIFEPFFTTKKEGEGTGLGLSVANAIFTGHGGAIDVESVVGHGTTFRLYLPLIPGVERTPSATAEPFPSGPRARGETVAIIDDEEAIVSLTEGILQGLGYLTLSFRSAEQFYAQFLRGPMGIQLVVTDQTMPGMTGLELARRLRKGGHKLPVVLMTGFSVQLRPELVEHLGKAVLVRKPFAQGLLARTVRELLDNVEECA